jgi:type IV secretion system protein VirB11
VADLNGLVVNRAYQHLETTLPTDNSRFTAIIPPAAAAPVIAIRKRASRLIPLEEYLKLGSITQLQYDFICKLIKARKNIVVTGGTGTGKTTMTNALIKKIHETYPFLRFGILEDTSELQCPAENFYSLLTNQVFTMQQALSSSLRLRPDVIILGEVRGAPANDLISAWNTGHEGGVCTYHANSARSALSRLAYMVSMAPNRPQ